MYCKVYSGACIGIEGRIVQVEVDVSNGLPAFNVIGDVSGEVKDLGMRIRTGIRNSGYRIPAKRYIINLSPADFHKTGTGFDLPAAVAVFCCIEEISPEHLNKSLFIGELSLNGNLVPVRGILSIISKAAKEGFEECFVPIQNAKEAAIVSGIQVHGAKRFSEVVDHLKNKSKIPITVTDEFGKGKDLQKFPYDFRDIRGQEAAKRCIEIAAAGWHHMLMIGPPGSGKTMLAERIPYILPELSLEESIDITKIYSAAGRLKEGSGLIHERPFRRPHHSISDKVLIGGGSIPKPGEMTLAHGGILFLDEFAEFSRIAMESLRQPMEMGEVCIHRLKGDYHYPARPLIIAAMNPCQCGYYPDREKCSCTPSQIRNYMKRISGPVMDRIDLCMNVDRVQYKDISGMNEDTMDSKKMAEQVKKAALIQADRFKGQEICYNSQMDSRMLKKYCRLDHEMEEMMEKFYEHYHLSARTYQKILKIARTISDLDGSDVIRMEHLTEAVCYRLPDENYGNEVMG